MRTEYEHPAKYSPLYDYKADRDKVEEHLDQCLQGKWHEGKIQHLGASAMLAEHLEDEYYGESFEVKCELREVLSLLFKYLQSQHAIYKFFAEDLMRHVETLYDDIDDEDDKEHARVFVEYVREYLMEMPDPVE